jgi:peptidoglycan hydrolase-like protein with peptidoglycan-binding domain
MTLRHWLILALMVAQLTGVALAGAASRPSGPSPTIGVVQLSLRILGYDPGSIDGLTGRRTIVALTAYAQDRRIVLNEATMELVLLLLSAEASEVIGHGAQVEQPLRGRRWGMLPVYQW